MGDNGVPRTVACLKLPCEGRSRLKWSGADPQNPVGTHVLVARESAGAQTQWVSVGITGHMDAANTAPDPDTVNRIFMPPDFQQLLLPL